MEKDTEKQILDELKNISQSLQDINHKLTERDETSNPTQTFFGLVKSLLLGFCVVGPAMAILWGVFLLLDSWVLG